MDPCFIVLLLLVADTVATVEDPLCVAKNCSPVTVCRVVTECHQNASCQPTAQCLDNPPRFSHVGVCQIGEPILVMTNGFLDDTRCGPTLPCPTGAYCNTELMDTYSTCCRSDPAKPVRQGQCPPSTGPKDPYCIDTCGNDGDCRYSHEKCCPIDGCLQCGPPTVPDPCKTKNCPLGKYCLGPDMPKCHGPGVCWEVGDCVPCRSISSCSMNCRHGYDTDANGCRVCQCKRVIPVSLPFRGETNLVNLRPAPPANLVNLRPAPPATIWDPHNGNQMHNMLWMYMFNNK
ncbi:unnamed protein product [Lymnaea stagnalis]|uniref:Uncharacterized protein n=1 Tax=Lymnaea stagnalis TaxID=6523 RepID=A0AAV2H0H6_LYMST